VPSRLTIAVVVSVVNGGYAVRVCYRGGVADRGKRRARKRLTVELEPAEEPLVRELKLAAADTETTVRECVLAAIREWLARSGRTAASR
jgi:hypothetical protein